MFDTFDADTNISIPPIVVERLRRQGADGWKPTYHGGADLSNGDQDCIVTLTHQMSRLRLVMRPDGNIFKMSGSMPRLLGHLNNGINLKGPADLVTVRSAIMLRLQEIAGINYSMPLQLNLTRLDLTLNLKICPALTLALHRNARHPMIRRETQMYCDDRSDSRREVNSIVLPGSQTRISLYNKKAEIYKRGRRGPAHLSMATRVEIQLKKAKHIARQMPWINRRALDLSDLRFDDGYRAFRNIMMKFPSGPCILQRKPDLVTTLALLDAYGPLPELGDISALDWYRVHHGLRSYQRMRREAGIIQRGRLSKTLRPFTWADALPADRLPDLVDVDHDGEETVIPSPYILMRPPPLV
jgi:hypothetical protein